MHFPARLAVTPLVVASLCASARGQAAQIVNLDNTGSQSPLVSRAWLPAISGDGRYVSFGNEAPLVHGAGLSAIYVRDRLLASTYCASRGLGGAANDGIASGSSISFDGRFVAYESWATNLVAGDSNGTRDVFVHDRASNTTERVSVTTAGVESHGDSAPPITSSVGLDMSPDGRFVVFQSSSPDLVAGDTNGTLDVFLRDRQTGVTERVSLTDAGSEANHTSIAPEVSSDGRYVVFASLASNLVASPTFPGWDVFRRDRLLGTTTHVSVSSAGQPARRQSRNPDISGDGRFVVFESMAPRLDPSVPATGASFEVYLRDMVAGTTVRVSRPLPGLQHDGNAWEAAISLDGNWVAFEDFSSNLVPNDLNQMRDVFRWNRLTGALELVNLGPGGVQALGGPSNFPAISADGSVVAFQSSARNLVVPDLNLNLSDVFVRQL